MIIFKLKKLLRLFHFYYFENFLYSKMVCFYFFLIELEKPISESYYNESYFLSNTS